MDSGRAHQRARVRARTPHPTPSPTPPSPPPHTLVRLQAQEKLPNAHIVVMAFIPTKVVGKGAAARVVRKAKLSKAPTKFTFEEACRNKFWHYHIPPGADGRASGSQAVRARPWAG